MADHPVRSASPVPAFAGFRDRAAGQGQPASPRRDGEPRAGTAEGGAADRVQLAVGAPIALRLLRERVLARTRRSLDLDDTLTVPNFAEILDGEPVPLFLGRLLSAQNQLAACQTAWSGEALRALLADALHDGAAETIELLGDDGCTRSPAIALVEAVLAQFGRRLAAVVG